MYVEEEEDYDNFMKDEVNYLNELNYEFNLNQRFVSVKNNEGNYFKCQTPFLKVLKPIHVTLNKKKTIAKKYIILELNDELDFNKQIADFTFIINKMHEISQEKIRKNSIEWFNTEFDDIGLDIKVRRPIEQQRECEFIRICLPVNKELEEQINELKKGDYVLCNITFRGLKVSNDYINEEWYVESFITQEEYEKLKKTDLLYEEIENLNKITTLLEEEYSPEIKDDKQLLENNNLEIEINNLELENNNMELEINNNVENINNNKLENLYENNDLLEISQVEVNNGECEQEKLHKLKKNDLEIKNNNTDNQLQLNKETLLETNNEEEIIKKNYKEKKYKKEKEKTILEKITENKLRKTRGNTLTTEQIIKKNKKILFF
jgi:hypothetical protein